MTNWSLAAILSFKATPTCSHLIVLFISDLSLVAIYILKQLYSYFRFRFLFKMHRQFTYNVLYQDPNQQLTPPAFTHHLSEQHFPLFSFAICPLLPPYLQWSSSIQVEAEARASCTGGDRLRLGCWELAVAGIVLGLVFHHDVLLTLGAGLCAAATVVCVAVQLTVGKLQLTKLTGDHPLVALGLLQTKRKKKCIDWFLKLTNRFITNFKQRCLVYTEQCFCKFYLIKQNALQIRWLVGVNKTSWWFHLLFEKVHCS